MSDNREQVARTKAAKHGIRLRHTKHGWYVLYGKHADNKPLGPWDLETVEAHLFDWYPDQMTVARPS